MISEEDKLRFSECKDCTTCKQWLKHCDAECCKIIFINISPEKINKGVRYLTLILEHRLGISDILYYKYHDVDYLRGSLRFKKDRIYVFGRKVYYLYPCDKLENNLCKLHGTSRKPIICTELTLDTAITLDGRFIITDNCLFKYKAKERVLEGGLTENGKKEEN